MTTKKLLINDRKAVRKVFGKSDEDVEEYIEIIRKWMKNQPHLPEVASDNMIELYLTMNKYSVELTKSKLDMYYTLRNLMPEIHENSHPQQPRMKEVSDKLMMILPMPKPTPDNYRVIVIKLLEYVEDFNVDTVFAHSSNIMEIKFQHDIRIGDVYLLDFEHLTMAHVVKMTPTHLKKMTIVLEEVFSNRIKGIHIINHPTFIDIVMSIAKTFMKAKIFSRIHVHKSIEEVYEHIPRKLLPEDYGGDGLSVQELNELWKSCLKENSDRFDKLDRMKVNESLRPKPLENDDILGYHGNFKRLNVD